MNQPIILTLWEPWATLWAHDLKKYETRPSTANYKEGQLILIHAAKRMDKMIKDLCEQEPFKSSLQSIGINSWKDLPTGCIIGACEWKKSYPIMNHLLNPVVTWIGDDANPVAIINGNEKAFGDWNQGRYAWEVTNKRILKQPIPYSGGQGYYQRYKGDIDFDNSSLYVTTVKCTTTNETGWI